MAKVLLLALFVAAASALPSEFVIKKLDEIRYQHLPDSNGGVHLADLWLKTSDLEAIARYNPDTQNVYHLFTRLNPTVSQPLLLENQALLGLTNYNPLRRTIIILHGWRSSVLSDINTALVPAFLQAEDVNVIVVDWSAGAGNLNYAAAVENTRTGAFAIARFITWLNAATGASPTQYHIVGHSLGAHMAGMIGRNLVTPPAYITGLDPALPGYITNEEDRLREDDGLYTEVIHTNAGVVGYLGPLGHVDFYPNGGINMPGCDSQSCDHSRSYFYLAESLTTGGFTGRRCSTFITAMTGNCFLWGNLRMGGLVAKTGSTGIYYLETNAAPPFSLG